MSEFKELIKSFAKSREYVRDFFVYGFKTREDFKNKSARTYDNERRRLESWLAGFVRQDYTEQRKNISLAIDAALLDTNPLYRVWKTKSFTDNDLLLHFFLLDFLSHGQPSTADTITDMLLQEYDVIFDVQAVRRKCNDYVKEGLLTKEKQGKELRYSIRPDFADVFLTFPGLQNAISYFQLVSPLGIAASTIMDSYSMTNRCFRVKHAFCVHTLEDEVLLELLGAMGEKRQVLLHLRHTKTMQETTMKALPMQIFVSTRTGRRFLCVYLQRSRRFRSVRMDAVKKVELGDISTNYDACREKLIKNHSLIWGTSFDNTEHTHTQWLKMTLHIQEPGEQYIINRLEQEGQGGAVTRIAPNTYTYEKEVFDAHAMLPWIRTFTGRIIDISSSSPEFEALFERDLQAMYEMYGIDEEGDSHATF